MSLLNVHFDPRRKFLYMFLRLVDAFIAAHSCSTLAIGVRLFDVHVGVYMHAMIARFVLVQICIWYRRVDRRTVA
jgi:hypothetical protein